MTNIQLYKGVQQIAVRSLKGSSYFNGTGTLVQFNTRKTGLASGAILIKQAWLVELSSQNRPG